MLVNEVLSPSSDYEPSNDRMPAVEPRRTEGVVFCYSVYAQADPGVMPRVLEVFAKRGLVPARWHSDVTGLQGRDLAIDVQVAGLTPENGHYIARCLRQISTVDQVLTAMKPG